jgi:rod shape-determining protein MreC
MKNFFDFLIRQYFFFLFLLLEVIAIIMVVQNNYYQRSAFINATNQTTGSFLSSLNSVSQYFSLADANRKLSEENARLLSEAKKFRKANDTKVYFSNDTVFSQQFEFMSARIIRNSTNKRNNFLTLDKGSKQGIEKEMGVITSSGVIGIVKEVSDNFSSVTSILHKESKISAKLKKNGQLGTVIWGGGNYLFGELIDIPTHVKLRIGDTVITSGYSTSFPEGIMIGTISEFKIEKGDNFYTIVIKFSTDYNSISYAYVIRNIMKKEIDKLNKDIPND